MDDSVGPMIEGWVLSFAFDSFEEGGAIYERARDLVFSHDVDASVYRVVLNGRTHVVVLGFLRMPPPAEEEMQRILEAGTDSILPEEVLLALSIRHAEVRAPGIKYERRGAQPPTVTFE